MKIDLGRELTAALDGLLALDVHAMPELVLLQFTENLLTERNRLDAAIAVAVQAMDVRDVTDSLSGRSTRAWMVEDEQLTNDEASRRLKVARGLPGYPVLREAFLAGEINHDHVRVILSCLRKLPADLRDVAEKELVEAARFADPTSLARACRELRARLLLDEDADAAAERQYAGRWLTVSATFDGMVHLQGMLDPEAGAFLQAALAPLLDTSGDTDERTLGQRRADALVELATHSLNRGVLPDHGGERPQVAVTVSWEALQAAIAGDQVASITANAVTANGQIPLSPAAARRIACDANILPAVMNSTSEVLDLGRSTRTWSRAQRRAARLRDKGCVWTKCQATLDRCELHHIDFWTHLGPTNIHNSAHLCHYHHRQIHHGNWTLTRNPNGHIDIRRKT